MYVPLTCSTYVWLEYIFIFVGTSSSSCKAATSMQGGTAASSDMQMEAQLAAMNQETMQLQQQLLESAAATMLQVQIARSIKLNC